MTICLPRAVDRFLRKNEDYGSGGDEFGAKGEVIEVGRKYKKIKAHIWDEQPLIGEPVEEVIDDMIGHLLLLKEQLIRMDAGGLPTVIEVSADDWTDSYERVVAELYG